jgi:XTP/dITP diphosphohydrolase
MRRIVVATRSPHKLREIRQILSPPDDVELLDLGEAGVEERAEEEEIEKFDTFAENALAKARYFAARTGLPVMADDSGLSVDALGGAPGVRSKRFSGRRELTGALLDEANNQLLLERLREVEPSARTAQYVCAVALVTPQGREAVFHGRCDGRILESPRGQGGFGYDPLFFVPELNATFAEVAAARKNAASHRARAVALAGEALARGWPAGEPRTTGAA